MTKDIAARLVDAVFWVWVVQGFTLLSLFGTVAMLHYQKKINRANLKAVQTLNDSVRVLWLMQCSNIDKAAKDGASPIQEP